MDAGLRDAGRMDAGRMDAGRMDAGRMDAGRRDSGRRDAGMVDAGRRSVALHFERRRRLVVGSSPRLGLTGEQTLELWIRPLGADGPVMLKGDSDAQYHLGVLLEAGDVLCGWNTPDGPRHVRAPVMNGVWTHVAIVYVLDAAGARMNVTLHLNGVVVATGTFPADISDSLNDLQLIFGNFMAVDVDEVRLWGLARATTDIVDGMNRRIAASTPGLVAYWRMDEFGGQIVLDRSLNGHDAILGDVTMRDAADPEWITDGPI